MGEAGRAAGRADRPNAGLEMAVLSERWRGRENEEERRRGKQGRSVSCPSSPSLSSLPPSHLLPSPHTFAEPPLACHSLLPSLPRPPLGVPTSNERESERVKAAEGRGEEERARSSDIEKERAQRNWREKLSLPVVRSLA